MGSLKQSSKQPLFPGHLGAPIYQSGVDSQLSIQDAGDKSASDEHIPLLMD